MNIQNRFSQARPGINFCVYPAFAFFDAKLISTALSLTGICSCSIMKNNTLLG